MKIWVAFALLLVGVASVLSLIGQHETTSALSAASTSSGSSGTRTPVVVELFTSEGCSSCPPADDVLARLEKTQPVRNAEIIALSEHVDYWNQLGWSDPFSSPQFSARQNGYAQVFRGDGVYTPQVVVDGQVQFVGGNLNQALEVIGKASKGPKAAVQISPLSVAGDGSKRFRVLVDRLPKVSPGDSAEVVMAITENDLRSSVDRGENAGRKLNHTAVVRQMWSLGPVDMNAGRFSAEQTLALDKAWKTNQLRVIALLQERASRHILGATSIALTAEN